MDSKVRGMDFEHMFVVQIVLPRSKKNNYGNYVSQTNLKYDQVYSK